MRWDLVIFDCDGVLVDSEVLALEVELAMLAEQGLKFEREDYVTRFMGLIVASMGMQFVLTGLKEFLSL